jgi:phage shock protein A
MGLFDRFRANFQARAYQAMDGLEDVRVNLNYSVSQLEDNRRELLGSLVDVMAAQHSLIEEHGQVEGNIHRLEGQARAAMQAGRDDLARMALERKQALLVRLPVLESHIENLGTQVDALRQARVMLDQKISQLKVKKEELNGMYESTRSQLRVQEALAGISFDLVDVSSTIQRTEERIQAMRSRIAAIQHLRLDDIIPGMVGDEAGLERQLMEMRRRELVEEELRSLRSLTSPDREPE